MHREEIDTFLKSVALKFKYLNIDSESYKEVYRDLFSFNHFDKYFSSYIEPISLVSIQTKLSNDYSNNPNLNRTVNIDTSFWAIENLGTLSRTEFIDKLYRGIKIYVPVEAEKIYYIVSKIINLSLSENIIMQLKVAPNMRNDAVVLRVSNIPDALKIDKLLNSDLNYTTNIRPNPFLVQKGKIAFAFDGHLSYNSSLSKLIITYIANKKNKKALDKVTVDNFLIFLKEEKKALNNNNTTFYCNLYGIIDEEKYKSFMVILSNIIKTIEGEMTIQDVFNSYNEVNGINCSFEYQVTSEDKKRAYELAVLLEEYYQNLSTAHEVIEKFIKTGDYDLFPVKNNIRNFAMESFTPEILASIIWETMISALEDTYNKYGSNQFEIAISDIMYSSEVNLDILTNQNDNRSYLSKISSKEYLKRLLTKKIEESSNYCTLGTAIRIVSEEIESKIKRENYGRK